MEHEPDYTRYTLAELRDVERHINRDAHPERFARLQAEIERRRSAPPSPPQPGPTFGPRTRLEMRRVLREAARELRAKPRPLARALAAPVLGLAALSTALQAVAAVGEPSYLRLWFLLLLAAYGMVSTIFAVSCHRLVLLGDSSLPNAWGLYFTRRELRFFGWAFLVAMVFLVATIPYGFLLVSGVVPVGGLWAEAAEWAYWVPAGYVGSRLSPVLPAAALSEPFSLGGAWKLSRGNGWRLTICLLAPIFGVSMLANATTWALGSPAGHAAIFAEAAALTLLGALEIVTLSVAYRMLLELADAPRA